MMAPLNKQIIPIKRMPRGPSRAASIMALSQRSGARAGISPSRISNSAKAVSRSFHKESTSVYAAAFAYCLASALK